MSDSPQSTPHGSPLVIPLTGIDHTRVDLAGGKGANLGELSQAGFEIPPGFVITTAAYDLLLENDRLGAQIGKMLAGLNQADSARVVQVSQCIRHMLERASIPPPVTGKVLSAYRKLGAGAVAVRSSATAEDLPEAAFAGQQETFLNVLGEQALLEAVQACWASLWSERAILYRQRQKIDQATVKLAVVVQQMVPADFAGVLFTANPVSGRRDEIVVDANPGLGEAVVSGLVTPDHFVIRKRGSRLSIHERRPGRREVIIQPDSEGGTRQVTGEAPGGLPNLPDRFVLQLAQIGLDIQQHFGLPQDVEWAVAKGKVSILQARPITALPEPLPPANRVVRMLAAMFAEMFPIRPYPLDQTTWIHAISDAAVDPLFGLVGISAPSIDQLFVEEDGVIVRFAGKLDIRPTLALWLAPARLLVLSLRYDPLQARSDPVLLQARQEARRLEAFDVHRMRWAGLLELVQEALGLALPLAGEIRRRYYPRALLSAGLLRAVLGFLGLGKLYGDLTSAPESATTDANHALEALAARVRADLQLAQLFKRVPADTLSVELQQWPGGRDFLVEYHAFLERFGHRELVLSSVLQPTWKDAPEIVLGIIQGLAQSQALPKREKQGWELARDRLLAHPLLRFSALRRFVLNLIAAARALWQVREDTHFEATRILPILRHTFFELGQRLVSVGVITLPEEIFHLKFSQLQQIGEAWPPDRELIEDLRLCVQSRKAKRASLESTPLIDPRLYQATDLDREALLTGMPGSPGIVEGPARVIVSPNEFGRLQAGDVLVAPYTNPGWTPLFRRAAAVVVDGGAPGSHAAIVAREYGLPAVLGTVHGTRWLVDGQRVRVDGSRGLVFACDEAPE